MAYIKGDPLVQDEIYGPGPALDALGDLGTLDRIEGWMQRFRAASPPWLPTPRQLQQAALRAAQTLRQPVLLLLPFGIGRLSRRRKKRLQRAGVITSRPQIFGANVQVLYDTEGETA